MIPIRDENPGLRTPVLTWALIAASIVVFFAIQPRDELGSLVFTYEYAAVPCELTTGEPLAEREVAEQVCEASPSPIEALLFPNKSLIGSVFVSMFLHAGILHLLGNMWSLWIFGNNVEDAFGLAGYSALYVASGVVATLGFVYLNPDTTVPLVGASGAIAGLMGAYLVLYPSERVVTIIPLFFFIQVVAVPAFIFLGFWLFGQFLLSAQETSVAWQAHLFGFAFGMVVALALRRPLLRRVGRLSPLS